MLVVRTYKSNATHFKGKTNAVKWNDCIKQLRCYFRDINRIKEKILAGEIINIPYVTIQRDRRIDEKKVRRERRKIFN